MRLLFLLLVSAAASTAQVTSSLTGTLTDPQGTPVAGIRVQVINEDTNAAFETVTQERGEYAVPSIPAANYRILVAAPGFRTASIRQVKVEAGVPLTVNIKLELGALAETIEVSGAAEVLQTATATVSSTLSGRQINQLPFVTRNVLELIVTQPGTQTVGTPRTSSINGLPKGSMNITLDGVNIQDNLLRSDDGFFTNVQPRTDAIEEVTVSTAGVGAESAGEGAAQVKFVTKSGSNAYHGGTFWQHRNTVLNANYYFNNRDRLPRDRLILNQFGGNLGGPILRDRIFFFHNFEEFRLPQSYRVPNSGSSTMPTPEALQGIFRYQDSVSRQVREVNLYNLARTANATLPSSVRQFPTNADPMVQAALSEYIRLATPQTGSLIDRITTNNDYNRNNFAFSTPGSNKRRFLTTRLDLTLTSKHQFNVVHNWQKYYANPDGVNAIFPFLPGTGTVLGHPDSGGTRRISFGTVGALRSMLTPRLTSEARFGMSGGGNSIFREEITPRLFEQWRGFAPTMNYVTSPFRASSQSRRHTPIWTAQETLTLSQGAHLWNFGAQFTQVNSYQQSVGSAQIPGISFAMAANDPANTGSTSLFTAANFPNSTSTNRSDAASLFAMLTGRVSSITRSVNLEEGTLRYRHVASVDRNRQREFALYLQDSWRLRQGLTLNYGVRWDVQFPFTNLSGTYTRVGYEGVWGISGVGNLFNPNARSGSVPQFSPAEPGQHFYGVFWRNLAPSLGFAWVAPKTDAPVLSWLAGREGGTVIRSGYSIATIREGMNIPISLWGSNQGRTVSMSVAPGTFPVEFGAPGSVWFRDPSLPARTEPDRPQYPLPVLPGNSVNDFDPKLKVSYAQSWTFSIQREISKSTVLDVRYVGNRGTKLWRQININEVNIVENGFLDEFKIARENLRIARLSSPTSVNFGNQGLPGQRPIPVIQTGLGLTSDTNFALNIERGEAGSLANSIATNTTRMDNLVRAGYAPNFFRVNPTTGSSGAYLVINGGDSSYNALQVEVRRRMSAGLLVQGSYTWSKSLSNMQVSSSTVSSQPTTLRNFRLDRGPSPWDLRHGFKVNFIYELPFGLGRTLLSRLENPALRRVLEGWEIAGVTRFQSGSPELLTGRSTFNQNDNGVVLYNMTAKDYQDMVKVRKTTAPNGFGVVYFLPQEFINNSMAAWDVGGFTVANLDRSKPYIGPQTEPGQLGYRIYTYGFWQQRWDLSLVKRTRIAERKTIELRAQFLNAFNHINFMMGSAANEVNTQGVGSTFGQVIDSYRDITVSGTNDPGGRVIEFVLRFTF